MVSVQGDVMRFLFFQGLLRNRAEVGENETLNGQRAERRLWQGTSWVLTGHTEGAEQRNP